MNPTQNKSLDGEWLTIPQMCELTNHGKGTVVKIANEAKAIVKIGRTTRIVKKKYFDYAESTYCI